MKKSKSNLFDTIPVHVFQIQRPQNHPSKNSVPNGLPDQIFRTESKWKQFFQLVDPVFCLGFCQNNLECLRVAEFSHYLSAHTAWRTIIPFSLWHKLLISYNGNGIKFCDTLRHCFEKCSTFCTIGWGVGCILNVTSLIDPSTSGEERCPNCKLRIWHISFCLRFKCLMNQILNHIFF